MPDLRKHGQPSIVGAVILGNELALDVNVLWLLILSLFFVFIVTAAAGRVIGVIACAGVSIFGGEGTRRSARGARGGSRDRCVRSRGRSRSGRGPGSGGRSDSGRSRGSDSSGPTTSVRRSRFVTPQRPGGTDIRARRRRFGAANTLPMRPTNQLRQCVPGQVVGVAADLRRNTTSVSRSDRPGVTLSALYRGRRRVGWSTTAAGVGGCPGCFRAVRRVAMRSAPFLVRRN